MVDLYHVLGVNRSASDEDVRSAYRRLAKELHPDRNPGDRRAEERFKRVSAAYEILKDKEKRARYDRGELDDQGRERFATGFGPGAGFGTGFGGFQHSRRGRRGRGRFEARTGPGGPTDHGGFEDVLNSIFGGGRAGFGFEGTTSAGAGDVPYELGVSFVDAARGGPQRLLLADGQAINVNVPAGVEDGQVLRLKGQGRGNGDALVTVRVRADARFRREGRDVHVDVDVPLATAIAGGKAPVPTIDGEVALAVPAGTSSGKVLRLRGRGIADPAAGTRGDQLARVLIVLPTDSEDVAALRTWARGKVND